MFLGICKISFEIFLKKMTEIFLTFALFYIEGTVFSSFCLLYGKVQNLSVHIIGIQMREGGKLRILRRKNDGANTSWRKE